MEEPEKEKNPNLNKDIDLAFQEAAQEEEESREALKVMYILAFILTAVIGGYIAYNYFGSEGGDRVPTIVEITGEEDVVNEPDLYRPVRISADFSDEDQARIEAQIQKAVDGLLVPPNTYNEWKNLASLRRTSGDIDGAAEIWKYLSYIRPLEAAPLVQLADIYIDEYKQVITGEELLLAAVDVQPKIASTYIKLFRLYTDKMDEKNKAEGILLRGIEENPANMQLNIVIANFYRNNNRYEDALVYYRKIERLATITDDKYYLGLAQNAIEDISF